MKEGLMGARRALATAARWVGVAVVTVALSSSEAQAQVSVEAGGERRTTLDFDLATRSDNHALPNEFSALSRSPKCSARATLVGRRTGPVIREPSGGAPSATCASVGSSRPRHEPSASASSFGLGIEVREKG